MNILWIARLVAIASVAVVQLSAVARAGASNGEKPAEEPPVGDFYADSHSENHMVQQVLTTHELGFSLPNTASFWTGTYRSIDDKVAGSKPVTGVIHPAAYVKKIVISKEEDSSINVQAWIVLDHSGNNPDPVEFSMEAKAQAYRDYNSRRFDDTLIASFPMAKYTPLILIRSNPTFASRKFNRYQYVTYTCYMHDYHGDTYVAGRLDRQAD